jgi:hypothetical protein
MAQAVSHCGGPGSIPEQSMWDLWWTEWQWGYLCYEYLGFPLSLSFHRCSKLVFTYTLFLPKGKRAKPGNLQKSSALADIGHHSRETYLESVLKGVQGLCQYLKLHSVEQKGDYYCRERRNQENVCGLI